MHLPENIRLVITRPAGQADALQQALSNAGIAHRHAPLLAIEPLPFDWPQSSPEMTIFTSPNAVEYSLGTQAMAAHCKPSLGQLLAIGSKTQHLLRQQTSLPVQVPEPMNSEGLLALPELSDLSDQSVLLVKGEGGRDLLPRELKQRGAKLTIIDCYRRRSLSPETASEADADQEEWWLISSAEAMQSLAKNQPDAKVVVSSDRLKRQANELGLCVMAQSDGAADEHWLALLTGNA